MIATTDDGFIGRVYVTSAYVWAVGFVVCWALFGLYAAAGWTAGAAVSVGVLRSLEIVVKRHFRPGANRARSALARFSIAKLVAVLALLTLVVWAGRYGIAFVIGFCAGLILAQAVIVLKTLGMLLSGRLSRWERVRKC